MCPTRAPRRNNLPRSFFLPALAAMLFLLPAANAPAQESAQPPIELLIEGTGFQRIPMAVPPFPSVYPV